MSCPQCEQVRINGVVCHETGCPEAWRDAWRECPECGCDFKPKTRDQKFCSASCRNLLWLPENDLHDELLDHPEAFDGLPGERR